MRVIEVPLEFPERHLQTLSERAYLVAIFEFAVVIAPLLDGVIGKVDEFVVQIVCVVFLRRCPNVPIVVEVALLGPVHRSEQPIAPYVKLTPLYQ